MNIKITKPIEGGTVRAIASKSHAHRLLIGAALSSEPSQIICSETSADIDATVRCLNALGAQIIYQNGIFNVQPVRTPVIGEKHLDCGESGSTLRFLLPVSCALGADAVFHMVGRLPLRPLTPLYDELISHGCALSPRGMNPLRTSGHLTGGKYTIPGNISSQFISGLMFALPILSDDSQIRIIGEMESQPYIDITIAALKEYGIVIKPGDHCYRISGRQHYSAQQTVSVEGDWSNAAFWLCAGAIAPAHCAIGEHEVTMTNLSRASLQGDKRVLTVLERFGARVTEGDSSVTVSPGNLKGIDLDAGDIPDLVPVLAAVAAVADGKTTIYNAGRLRIKESDRLSTITDTLRQLGADITETPDGLFIHGKSRLEGGTVSSCGDHRIAMAAAIASTVCRAAVTIMDAEAVGKSYPGFFRDFTALGGQTEEVV